MRQLFLISIFLTTCFFGCGMADKGAMPYDMEAYSKTEEMAMAYEESEKYAKFDEYDVDDVKSAPSGGSVDELANDKIKIAEKIIKTANISIEVEEYEPSMQKIREKVKAVDGFISNENEVHNTYRSGNTVTIRVLSENFDKLVNDIISGEEKIVSKNINSLDVTEEFVDIQSRLKTKREVEKQYHELLKKAHTIEEILIVQQHIRQIREEIESKEGRLKYLKDQVGYSTIVLEIYMYNDDWMEPTFGEKSGEALEKGWEGFKMFLVGMMYLWPLWLIIGITLFVLISLIKRRKRRKAGK